jgi:tetratricopeptide (TPR) repeat protein
MSVDFDRVSAAVHWAETLCDTGRAAEAVAVLAPLIAHHSDDPRVWLVLGRALLASGDAAGALRAANAAGALVPADPRPHALTSWALTDLGQHQAAVSAAVRAVEAAPQEGRWHHLVAVALLHGDLRPQQAYTAAVTAVRLAPWEPAHHLTLGIASEVTGRWPAAREHYLQALRLDPNNPAAHHQLARSRLGRRGRRVSASSLAAAATGFAAAAAIDPAQQQHRFAFHQVVRTFLTRTGGLVCLTAFAAGQLHYHGLAELARLVAAAGLVLPVVFAARFVARLPRHLRKPLADTARRQWFGLTLTVLAAVLLAAAAAAPPAAVYWLLVAAAAAALIGRIRAGAAADQRLRREGARIPHTLGTATLTILAIALTVLGLVALLPALGSADTTTATASNRAFAVVVDLCCWAGLAATIRTIHTHRAHRH